MSAIISGFTLHPSEQRLASKNIPPLHSLQFTTWCVFEAATAQSKKKNLTRHTPKGPKKKKTFCASPCEDGVRRRRWRAWTCLRSLVFCAVLKGQLSPGCGNHRCKSSSMRKLDSVTYELRTFTLNYLKACVSLKFHVRKQKLAREITWDLHLPVWILHFHTHDEHS